MKKKQPVQGELGKLPVREQLRALKTSTKSKTTRRGAPIAPGEQPPNVTTHAVPQTRAKKR